MIIKNWLRYNNRWLNDKLEHRAIYDILPNADSIDLLDILFNPWSLPPNEQYALAQIIRSEQPNTIFEFGTYDGGGTLLMARHGYASKIFTIDFSSSPEPHFKIGSRFHGTDAGKRITQLSGDSTQYDFSGFFGRCDLILIDGGHEENVVMADTENALKMIAPGGIILWHDYPYWRGVRNVVNRTAKTHKIIRIANTLFALLRMENERKL